jgi:creatinine amidohydrolase
MKGHLFEDLTWPEAEVALKEDKVFVIPLGARLKEHGFHLPLNNDWVLAEYFAKKTLELNDIYLLPTIQHGFYPAFVQYPGSIHIELDVFINYLKQMVRSLSNHGAKKIYFLNMGISTLYGLAPLKKELGQEVMIEYTNLLELDQSLPEGLAEQEGGTHADELETSMMLAINSEMVQLDKAQKDYHQRKGRGPFTRDPKAETGLYSPTGAWGDPTKATLEKGKTILEIYVREISQFLEKFSRDDFRPKEIEERFL